MGSSLDLYTRLGSCPCCGTQGLPTIPDEFGTSHVADMLVLRVPLPHERMKELYCELDVERRARAALAEHARAPTPEA